MYFLYNSWEICKIWFFSFTFSQKSSLSPKPACCQSWPHIFFLFCHTQDALFQECHKHTQKLHVQSKHRKNPASTNVLHKFRAVHYLIWHLAPTLPWLDICMIRIIREVHLKHGMFKSNSELHIKKQRKTITLECHHFMKMQHRFSVIW